MRYAILAALLLVSSFAYAEESLYGCAEVLYVVDGDTLDADFNQDGKIDKKTERVRILGIDTFEFLSEKSLRSKKLSGNRKYKKLKKQAQQYNVTIPDAIQRGTQAKRVLQKALLGQTACFIQSGISRGLYGRLLAYVEFQGHDVAEYLLQSGLAYTYKGNKHHSRYSEYLNLSVLD